MNRSELPKGIKKTKQRQLVWDILCGAETPVTAMDIASRLEQQGDAVWLSTIYRVLDTLSEQGAVVKTAVLEGGMTLYEPAGGEHRHYAVCVGCKRVIAMENCPMECFDPQLREEGFQVLGHRLQMYGYCGRCGKAGEGNNSPQ